MRFRAEFKVAAMILNNPDRSYGLAQVFGKYLKLCTWKQLEWYSDSGFIKHYNLDTNKRFDMDKCRRDYLSFADMVEKELALEENDAYFSTKKRFIELNTAYCNKLRDMCKLLI